MTQISAPRVEIADRVAVMYAGRIVEEASMSEILRHHAPSLYPVLLGSRPKEGLEKVMPTALHSRRAAGSGALAARLRLCRALPAPSPVCGQSLPPTGIRRRAPRGELPPLGASWR
ncbi:hypothetical protein LNQ03_08520 [Klebsiella pneumoniae subsp. pneumoniae]|nr:hypothetical protein [Klebsiella pneumoniae subsp. pneumoniae]